MIYSIDEKGTHSLLQNSCMVSLFENHVKDLNDPIFNKIPIIVSQIKKARNITKDAAYFIRDDLSTLSKVYKKLAQANLVNIVLIPVDWSDIKNTGVKAINTMLEHCEISICIFDGTNKIEKIYLSMVDPFKTINYVVYTGSQE